MQSQGPSESPQMLAFARQGSPEEWLNRTKPKLDALIAKAEKEVKRRQEALRQSEKAREQKNGNQEFESLWNMLDTVEDAAPSSTKPATPATTLEEDAAPSSTKPATPATTLEEDAAPSLTAPTTPATTLEETAAPSSTAPATPTTTREAEVPPPPSASPSSSVSTTPSLSVDANLGSNLSSSTASATLTSTDSDFVYKGDSSPPNITRDRTLYDWCSCGTGLTSVTIWPNNENGKQITIPSGTVYWINWEMAVHNIRWKCDGMAESRLQGIHVPEGSYISLNFYSKVRMREKVVEDCGNTTGRLHWNTWRSVKYLTSVPFYSPSDGYACIKIPVLLRTFSGTLLAFAEARLKSCSDFAQTDLVYKRSFDNGQTWTALRRAVTVSGDPMNLGVCGSNVVVGNAAPVQIPQNADKYVGRILLPHMRNNLKAWITYSDDEGDTWSDAEEIPNVTNTGSSPDCKRGMSYFGYNIDKVSLGNLADLSRWMAFLCTAGADPYNDSSWTSKLTGEWQFVGLGPPGSIAINGNRIVVPGYHSYLRGLSADQSTHTLPISQLYNDFAVGHTMISEDYGDTWSLGNDWPIGNGANEHQIVQLDNGSLMMNSRSLSTGSPQFRLQAISNNVGRDWKPSEFVMDLPEPFNGCQGSLVRGMNGTMMHFSHPDPSPSMALVQDFANDVGCLLNLTGRDNMTVWTSSDGGVTYPKKKVIDRGMTGQSSLQFHDGTLLLLYDQVDPIAETIEDIAAQVVSGPLAVQVPDRLVFIDATAAPEDSAAPTAGRCPFGAVFLMFAAMFAFA